MTIPGVSGPTQDWRALGPDHYADLFPRLFTHAAFRLEQLDQYRNPIEDEPYQLYRRRQPDDLAWRQPWLDLVTRATSAGKTMTRVHVVSEPWTDYSTFELHVVYPPAVRAGEQVRIARRGVPGLPDHDFWLTEEPATVARMTYTAEGEWAGVHLTDRPELVAPYLTWRAIAVAASAPLDTYLDSVRRHTA